MKIYIGKLSYEVTTSDLMELFKAYGDVGSANIVRDRDSGESRGFGFVEMASREQAESAISELDGKEIKGRRIIVSEAKPRRQDRFGGGRRGGGGGFRR